MTDESKDPSSPACLAHEADDAYMGFATKAEISAFLAGLETASPDAIRRMLPRIRDDVLYKLLSEKLPR
jgi:hypothetical protein